METRHHRPIAAGFWRPLLLCLLLGCHQAERGAPSPPTLAILSPPSGAILTEPVPLELHVPPSLASLTVLVDGEPQIELAPPFDWTIDPASLASGAHTLEISAQGAQAALAYVLVDREPPWLEVLAPAEGEILRDKLTLTLHVGDDGAVAEVVVWVDEALADQMTDPPYGLELPLAAGEHEVVVEARDQAWRSARASRRFMVDLAPPSLTLDVPPGPFSQPQRVALSMDDDLGIALVVAWVAGEEVYRGQDIPGAVTVAGEGRVELKVKAVDRAGRETVARATLSFDDRPPDLVILAPQPGEAVGRLEVELGVDEDLAGLECWIDGLAALCDPAVLSWAWDLDLASGDHHLRVRALDGAGLASEAQVAFVVDRAPPEANILWPEEGLWVAPPVVAQVRAIDDAGLAEVTLSLDGVFLPLAPDQANVDLGDLAEGEHRLTIAARDRAGGEARDEVAFGVDTMPPVVSLSGVEEGGYVGYGEGVRLAVGAEDGASGVEEVWVEVEGLGIRYFDQGTHSWDIPGGALAPGLVRAVATARDGAGHETRWELSFFVRPSLWFIAPEAGQRLEGSVCIEVGWSGPGQADLTFEAGGRPLDCMPSLECSCLWDAAPWGPDDGLSLKVGAGGAEAEVEVSVRGWRRQLLRDGVDLEGRPRLALGEGELVAAFGDRGDGLLHLALGGPTGWEIPPDAELTGLDRPFGVHTLEGWPALTRVVGAEGGYRAVSFLWQGTGWLEREHGTAGGVDLMVGQGEGALVMTWSCVQGDATLMRVMELSPSPMDFGCHSAVEQMWGALASMEGLVHLFYGGGGEGVPRYALLLDPAHHEVADVVQAAQTIPLQGASLGLRGGEPVLAYSHPWDGAVMVSSNPFYGDDPSLFREERALTGTWGAFGRASLAIGPDGGAVVCAVVDQGGEGRLVCEAETGRLDHPPITVSFEGPGPDLVIDGEGVWHILAVEPQGALWGLVHLWFD